MIINHNMAAMNAQRQMGINSTNGAKSMEKLSSGLRINRAGDDAAGLAISEKMRGQIRGLDQAGRNAQDGISMIQTAEGGLNETHSILQRMNELATQAANGALQASDRTAIGNEITQLNSEVDRIAYATKFNGTTLLDGNFGVQLSAPGLAVGSDGITAISISGANKNSTYTITATGAGTYLMTSGGNTQTVTLATGTAGTLNFSHFGISITVNGTQSATGIAAATAGGGAAGTIITGTANGVTLQIGAENQGAQQLGITIGKMDSTATGLNTTAVAVGTVAGAQSAITTIQAAIDSVSAERSKLGAFQNRLEHTINNLGTTSENLQSAESRIRDVNMASEMMAFTKNNILSQAAQAMLAQANQAPQGVLQLLR